MIDDPLAAGPTDFGRFPGGDGGDIEAAARLHQFDRRRLPEQTPPSGPLWAADHDAGDIAQSGIFAQRGGGGGAVERDRLGTQRLRQPQDIDAAVARPLSELEHGRRFHRNDHPFGVHRIRESFTEPHQLVGLLIGSDRHQEPVAGEPRLGCPLLAVVGASRRVNAIGGTTQRELAQGNQVRLPEKLLDSWGRVTGAIDRSRPQPREEFGGWQVDQLDLVGLIENAIRNGFRLPLARNPLDDVVQAFQVLDVERGPYVDSRGAQLLDVLPSLRMARRAAPAEPIGVGELIDQQQAGTARACCIEVQVAIRTSAASGLTQSQLLEPLQQALDIGPAMRLDVTDHHIEARIPGMPRRLEHRVGLADTRRRAKEYFQPTAARCRRRAIGRGHLSGSTTRR